MSDARPRHLHTFASPLHGSATVERASKLMDGRVGDFPIHRLNAFVNVTPFS